MYSAISIILKPKFIMNKTLINQFLVSLFLIVFTISCSDDSEIESINNDENLANNKSETIGGVIPLSEEEYNSLPVFEAKTTKALKSKVSLLCPPIKNQGNEESCVGWGVGYAARSIMWRYTYGGPIRYDGTDYNTNENVFSPEYIYNQIKINPFACDKGSYIKNALSLIYNQGVCVWDDMPDITGICTIPPNDKQVLNASNYKIASWYTVPIEVNTIKSALSMNKPVIVGGRLTPGFRKLGFNRKLTAVTNVQPGGHCYCIVGYDDSLGSFQVYNSWGTSWGTYGYGWVSYDIIKDLWFEAYSFNE